jgi:hypothetical protein
MSGQAGPTSAFLLFLLLTDVLEQASGIPFDLGVLLWEPLRESPRLATAPRSSGGAALQSQPRLLDHAPNPPYPWALRSAVAFGRRAGWLPNRRPVTLVAWLYIEVPARRVLARRGSEERERQHCN